MKQHPIYIGWDSREIAAWDVARHSFRSRISSPIRVLPLKLSSLSHILTRPIERVDGKMWCPISQAPMSTEFAISRFCVPHLQREGWALGVDCDVVCLADVQELFDLADERYAVMVVKHKQETGSDTKMDGQKQVYYNRKNWSSVILWNCSHPANRNLTLEALNTWPGRDLHAFRWLDDSQIGELPPEWNVLAGINDIADISSVKLLHFTLGGPWLPNWKGSKLDDVWLSERQRMFNQSGVPD